MAQFYSPNRRVATRRMLTVTADSLDPFGQGVARHQGKTIFVGGVLPGERADVQLTEEKRQFAHAKLIRLLTRSPQRVEPRCPHFNVCGGCQQQHADSALQQQSKASALVRLMARETGAASSPVAPIAGPSYAYRRRARLALYYQAKQQRLLMGYRQAGSHDLVDVRACPILRPELEKLLTPLRDCLSRLQAVKRLGHVELVQADNGPLLVLRHLDPLSQSDCQALGDFAQRQGVSVYLAPEAGALTCLSGEEPVYHVAGLTLAFSPRDFIQVNDAVNQQMVSQALIWLDVQPQDRILDLFCGMGNFTLPLAQRAASVVGVEGVMALVEKGRENARRNSLANVTFFHQNLEDDVAAQPWAAQGFDKILLDPARAGAAGVMTQIVKLAPQRVVYVSCNPATLARDSKILLAAGYRLANVTMLDMFPHTGHLESMALFLRDSDGAVR
ncbi:MULTISPECIES: 23S rRNA (uracil(1939)-C(5))-methyltransferase RlmD [unclassified Brenneria]|uniref:23S rRNA (uracil(1939)-C(5))-methyltransferase RlmD n=1 Tax=unclassified Brenneria TaxID=2634434 RepID=UPI0015527ADC|nr:MULTISPECIES: 23S rRNA (uracil(1939)-C(5))-methyltransferase RlmD [unclassified Brenneria]MBJ7223654.1 23S rRNA (uracil(1939)-C(5))-methyltransferase RlmD [Brenneria sp. L3-3C-1]MEE3644896.1 23S rRNA (uracil(1939)-C(5))-methyltransferase RlmD [Brenneria sp. L3_3C_1]MEE3652354.1 23S rRNA (uracil(1939)-C(5))-methyltransferase RlmD [Brenneria sp. HEZEL_4_2_4]NPD02311.1 23S rRNA (uracil(1939)-C(5))-methyltransferase RlmD [Brenneria sp. hezel4-2-4]